jgi:hypothetical protein
MSITDARQVGSYLLGYPFRFEVTGHPAILVEKCKLPGVEFEVVEVHGGGQTLAVKQAGGEKVTEGTLDCVVPAKGPGRAFWQERRMKIRSRDTKQYYIDATMTLLGPDDTPNVVWDLMDYWESKIEEEEFDAADKKKLVRIKVTFQCNDCQPRYK